MLCTAWRCISTLLSWLSTTSLTEPPSLTHSLALRKLHGTHQTRTNKNKISIRYRINQSTTANPTTWQTSTRMVQPIHRWMYWNLLRNDRNPQSADWHLEFGIAWEAQVWEIDWSVDPETWKWHRMYVSCRTIVNKQTNKQTANDTLVHAILPNNYNPFCHDIGFVFMP